MTAPGLSTKKLLRSTSRKSWIPFQQQQRQGGATCVVWLSCRFDGDERLCTIRKGRRKRCEERLGSYIFWGILQCRTTVHGLCIMTIYRKYTHKLSFHAFRWAFWREGPNSTIAETSYKISILDFSKEFKYIYACTLKSLIFKHVQNLTTKSASKSFGTVHLFLLTQQKMKESIHTAGNLQAPVNLIDSRLAVNSGSSIVTANPLSPFGYTSTGDGLHKRG